MDWSVDIQYHDIVTNSYKFFENPNDQREFQVELSFAQLSTLFIYIIEALSIKFMLYQKVPFFGDLRQFYN